MRPCARRGRVEAFLVPVTARRGILWALAAAWLLVSPAGADELRGTPQVIDGDTLAVQGHRLRLRGVDAPELEQRCWLKARLYDCGQISRAALLDLTAGSEVVCQRLGPGPEDTTLARCTAEGYDLSEGMAYTGWALAIDRGDGGYRRFEARARRSGHGLWRGRFVDPWDWRAGVRLPEEAE